MLMERRKNKYIAKKIMVLGTKGGVGKSFVSQSIKKLTQIIIKEI